MASTKEIGDNAQLTNSENKDSKSEKQQKTNESDGIVQNQNTNENLKVDEIEKYSNTPSDGKTIQKEPSIIIEVRVPQSANAESENNKETSGLVQITNGTETEEEKSERIPKTEKLTDENDMDEYDPDLYITDEERKAFEYMLDQRREEIAKQRETFKNWAESITRRRMFALSRLRKIKQCHKERMVFYEQMESYIKSADDVINSNDSTEHSEQTSCDFVKESNNQTFEDLVRENTGFVLKSDTKGNEFNQSKNSDNSDNENIETNSKRKQKNSASEDNVEDVILKTNGNADDDCKRNISNNNESTPTIVPVTVQS
ncbi:inner centromere protein A-like isoform X2 [Mytilus californianus]|uniref:inner centromere protein A-like isoform X2 n=2 Tax=Mytilus californianus TaxID=6549 RepID=UPI002246D2EA|nr:inner centromere protein A-like isoform X2 [Mytilus californianus]XP_052066330.1 inner centromere protein A-like isoform X2 [Mytilus californianus]XP_052066332.1 inner centromere protein A-like isoform X2 [Mytilus californianus]XP_052066333.1 inner centromere protein A-like isoform X2 [Mytilus californianus]XP_052066334.1 inner centromere protein A-like isoform X2 [Mytilus californianus]XP_052066335.1 inner centromere protein A-like isoform X2 [Mytilus californianus]XP_052066336.1 inner ce